MNILSHIPSQNEILAVLDNMAESDPNYEYYCALLNTHINIEDSRVCGYQVKPCIDYYPKFARETVKKLRKHGYKVSSIHKFHCNSWIWISRFSWD